MKTDKPNIPRHQHYVPRVYLKNFAVQKEKNYFVDAYDIKKKELLTTNIKNICGERDLYTLDSKYHSDPLTIEKNVYANTIEPMYEAAYGLLIDDNITTISDTQRVRILLAVYQFYFRNPKLLNDMIAFQLPAIETAYNEAKGKGEKRFIFLEEEYDIENTSYKEIQNVFSDSMRYTFKTVHLEQFRDLVRTRAFDSINVYKIIDDSYFITSDNPFPNLSILNPGSRDAFASDMMFYLPLNSTYCLCLKPDKATTERNKIHRQNVDCMLSLSINHIMLCTAQRFIIGSKEAIKDVAVHFADLFSSEATDQFINFATDLYKGYIEAIPDLECLKSYIDEYKRTGKLTTEKFTEMLYKYAAVVKAALLENDKN